MNDARPTHHRSAQATPRIPGPFQDEMAPPLPEGMLQVGHLTVRRGNREILRDISFTLAPGTITAVVGPSGVGKSSLLAALTGLLAPTRGSIRVSGLGDLTTPGVLQRHRRQTATIFQEHALVDRLSALDNVLLGLADLRHPLSPLPWSRPLRERAARALHEVGLLHRADTRAARLSGGERQRVGIARALVRAPRLLLGDEPFSAVDPALTRSLGQEFRTLVESRGLTALLVLHQMDVARCLADRIVALGDGQVVFDGPAAHFDLDLEARVFPPLPSDFSPASIPTQKS